MTIIIIGPAYPYRGGIAAYSERLALEFQNQGHDVTVYTFSKQYPNFLFPGKTQLSEEEEPRNLKIKRAINSTNPFNWIKVGNDIKRIKPDLVLVKFWLPFMGPCFGTILRRIRKNKHTKVISLLHNIIPHESRIGDRTFTKYFVKPVQAFVAMSQNVYSDLDLFKKDAPKVLSPHPLFDNFGKIASKQESLTYLKLDPNFKYILFFGLVRKYKGLDILLEALNTPYFKDSNLKLIIAGEYYSDKEFYTKLIQEFNLEDKVIQADKFIPDGDVKYYFGASELLTQPYKSATQSGVTQIAYHFNKPMVVSNVGGLKELIPHEKVGYVVPPEPIQIRDAIFRFFEDTDHASMINNIKIEKKKYSWDILSQNILELLDKVK